MGQFINSDCNTWKVSRPSPACYFMAAHKSRPGRTTAAATTAIKINTAAANTIIGGEPSGQSAANSCHKDALSAVCRRRVPRSCSWVYMVMHFLGPGQRPRAAHSPLLKHDWGSEQSFNITPLEPTQSIAQPRDTHHTPTRHPPDTHLTGKTDHSPHTQDLSSTSEAQPRAHAACTHTHTHAKRTHTHTHHLLCGSADQGQTDECGRLQAHCFPASGLTTALLWSGPGSRTPQIVRSLSAGLPPAPGCVRQPGNFPPKQSECVCGRPVPCPVSGWSF